MLYLNDEGKLDAHSSGQGEIVAEGIRHGVDEAANNYQTYCGLPLPGGPHQPPSPNPDQVTCPGCQTELKARVVETALVPRTANLIGSPGTSVPPGVILPNIYGGKVRVLDGGTFDAKGNLEVQVEGANHLSRTLEHVVQCVTSSTL